MTDWPLIVVKQGLYGTLMVLFGLASFALYTLPGHERRSAFGLRAWLSGSAGVGLLLSAAILVLMAAGMAGTTPFGVDRETITMVATAPGVGAAFMVRMSALVLALLLARWAASTAPLVAVAAAGGAALGSLAWNGHGAMNEGIVGWTHLGADIAHLLAAGIWVGALVALILLVARRATRTTRAHLILSHRALHGFSTAGTLAVGVLVASGLISSWVLVGPDNLGSLGASLYGQLLIAKLGLFGLMLVLASVNRFHLTPAFAEALNTGDTRRSLGALRRSLAIEAVCALAILGLISWAGTLAPPASDNPEAQRQKVAELVELLG